MNIFKKLGLIAVNRWNNNHVFKTGCATYCAVSSVAVAVGASAIKEGAVAKGVVAGCWLLLGGVIYFCPNGGERDRILGMSEEEAKQELENMGRSDTLSDLEKKSVN